MIKKEKDDLVWFEFEKLQLFPNLRHAIFSRRGGQSIGPFLGLNFSVAQGDDAASVQHNKNIAFDAIGLNVPLVLAQQVHAAYVHKVDAFSPERIPNCDAFISNKKKLALGIEHADCQAAIFYDPIQNAIACVHSGWRGNCQNIYQQTIMQMQQHYGSNPADIIACISPSLGPAKAEFIHYKSELPESFWPFRDDKNHFNLWEIARWQLLFCGINPENIELSGLCTFEDPEHFYSYRRDKLCGRHLCCVWLDS